MFFRKGLNKQVNSVCSNGCQIWRFLLQELKMKCFERTSNVVKQNIIHHTFIFRKMYIKCCKKLLSGPVQRDELYV